MPKDPLVLQAMGIPPEAVATTMATTPQAAVQSHLPLRLLSEQPVMHRANIDRNPERVSFVEPPYVQPVTFGRIIISGLVG